MVIMEEEEHVNRYFMNVFVYLKNQPVNMRSIVYVGSK